MTEDRKITFTATVVVRDDPDWDLAAMTSRALAAEIVHLLESEHNGVAQYETATVTITQDTGGRGSRPTTPPIA